MVHGIYSIYHIWEGNGFPSNRAWEGLSCRQLETEMHVSAEAVTRNTLYFWDSVEEAERIEKFSITQIPFDGKVGMIAWQSTLSPIRKAPVNPEIIQFRLLSSQTIPNFFLINFYIIKKIQKRVNFSKLYEVIFYVIYVIKLKLISANFKW